MSRIRHFRTLATIVALSFMLVSCGFGGDDDEPEATATTAAEIPSQQEPTATLTETEPPSTPDAPFVLVTPTSEAEAASPGAMQPSGPSATIVDDATPTDSGTPSIAEEGTPELLTTAVATGDPDAAATPEQDASGQSSADASTPAANVGTGSDGTSGPSALPEDATPAVPDDVDASPSTTVNAIEVDSCDVVEVPPYADANTAALTVDDVNFRFGPGSDCESVLDGPLGPNVAVEIVGGPVVRSDDPDGTLWVQVTVGDNTGWIALEFLEPVASE